MSLTIAQQKKHLLLLNKLHRNALKAELIPAPSKLSDDKVEKLFNEFFKKKEHYYIPKITSTILKIDEEEFKKLYKEPKKAMKKEVKPKEEVKKEEVKEEKEEDYDVLSSELQKLILLTNIKDIIKALVNLKYKGKIQNNKILMSQQLLQNFNTVDKIKKLINELKKY